MPLLPDRTPEEHLASALKRLRRVLEETESLPPPDETTQTQYQALRASLSQDAEDVVSALVRREWATYGMPF